MYLIGYYLNKNYSKVLCGVLGTEYYCYKKPSPSLGGG